MSRPRRFFPFAKARDGRAGLGQHRTGFQASPRRPGILRLLRGWHRGWGRSGDGSGGVQARLGWRSARGGGNRSSRGVDRVEATSRSRH